MLSQQLLETESIKIPTGSILPPLGSNGKYSFSMEGNRDALPQFSVWLRRQLHRRGWRAADLARETDLASGTISRWINGQRLPREGKHIHALSVALNIHQDEILEQLDMRDGGADHMSLAVRRLQPLIDSVQWDEGSYRLIESTLESLRAMQSGQFNEPTASWEDE